MKRLITFFILIIIFCSMAYESRAEESIGPTIEDYQWWREARFGIFIHWNMSSLLALGGGSWYRQDNDQLIGKNQTLKDTPPEIKDGTWKKYGYQRGVPQKIYDNLYKIFNPEKFNADEWVEVFKKAGAKYIVFTTKHHDGFCMFDSQYTDYNIMNTPFGRDIAKELSDACRRNDIKVIWYYSKADWYDPRYDVKNPKPYQDYMINQVQELCSKYGDIKGFWWDGGKITVDGMETVKAIYKLQPGAIYNGRGPKNAPGISFGTPEQKLGNFNMDRPWETCAIMQGEGWFYNGAKNIKSVNTCLRLLIDSSGGDGNLLLDFGPNEKGEIPENIKKNYIAMGKWLKKYGESIYGARGGPYKPGHWGVSTRKGNKIYLHITQLWPGGVLELPSLPVKIKSCKTLTGDNPEFKQSKAGLKITLDPQFHQQPDTIIVLEMDKSAMDISPIECEIRSPLNRDPIASASSAIGKSHRGSPQGVFESIHETGEISKHFGEEGKIPKKQSKSKSNKKHKISAAILKEKPWLKQHRGHIWRYWMSKSENDDPKPWLEFKTAKPVTFTRVDLLEKFSRIKSFELQYHTGQGWKTFYSGGELGVLSLHPAKPITASRVRILITDFQSDKENEGPALHKFDVF